MKKRIFTLIILLLTFASISFGNYFPDVILTSVNGTWLDTRVYADIDNAVAAALATGEHRDLYIVRQEATVALTLHPALTVKFFASGSIANSGQLTINTTNIIASNRQIFTGAGDIDWIAGATAKTSWFVDLDWALEVTNDDTMTLEVTQAETTDDDMAVGNNVTLKWNSPFIITIDAGDTLSNVKNIESGNYQILAGAGDVDFLDGTRLKLNWFNRLRTVITWIETEYVSIVVSGANDVDFTDTTTSNEFFDFVSEYGWFVIAAGVDLEIASPGSYFALPNQRIFDISAVGSSITFTNPGFARIDHWGPDIDGTDVSAIIQSAVDALENAVSGSTLWFDPGSHYGIADTVNVEVAGGLTIESDMGYPIITGANLLTGAFVPVAGGDLTQGMFRTIKVAGLDSNYKFIGLAAVDISDLAATHISGKAEDNWDERRVVNIRAFLNLDWFSVGTVENIYCWVLKGSCIRLGTAARANMENIWTAYVGGTDLPAIYFEGQTAADHPASGRPDTIYAPQNMDIKNLNLEVSYYAESIRITAYPSNLRFDGMGFEGFNDAAIGDGDSQNSYIVNDGLHIIMKNMSINGNGDETNPYIVNTGAYNQYSDIAIISNHYNFFNSIGDHTILSDVIARGPTPGVAINHDFVNSTGAYFQLSNISTKDSGRIVLDGARPKFTNSTLNNIALTTGPVIDITVNAIYAKLDNITVKNTNDNVDGVDVGSAVDVSLLNMDFDNIGDTGGNTANPIDLNGVTVNTVICNNTYTNIFGTVQNVSLPGTETQSVSGCEEGFFGPYRVSSAATGGADTFLVNITFDGNNADYAITITLAGTLASGESFSKEIAFAGRLASAAIGDNNMVEVYAMGDALRTALTFNTGTAAGGNVLRLTATNTDTTGFNGEITVKIVSRNNHAILVYVDNNV